MTNLLGFLLTLLYIVAVIGIGEGLRRWRGFGPDFTRKVVHIGVGMVMWIIPALFDNSYPIVIACIGFMGINFLDWKYGFFAAMTSSDRSNLGTVWFPLACAAAALIFWGQPPLMVAAIMPLTWGDGLAPVIGRKYGKRKYTIFGSTRTLEGSLAFWGAASLWVWLALGGGAGVVGIALTLGLITALIEAVSPWGLDNLTVTAAAILVLATALP